MSDWDAGRLAEGIVEDIRALNPARPLPLPAEAGLAAAYEVQDALTEKLVAGGVRGPVCGYKMAVNSPAAMARFGLSEPACGRLFADQKFASPAELKASDYVTFVIEPEIGVVLSRALEARDGGHDRASAAAFVDRFVPVYELIDLRGDSFDTMILTDAIAQNVYNAGVVVGGPGCAADAVDVDALLTEVFLDGELIAEPVGAAPQHPLDAVAFMANHLPARGLETGAGTLIICGSHIPPKPISAPASMLVRMGPLGEVSFAIS